MSQINERIRRANAFYYAARNPRVLNLLRRVGFTEATLAEGATLLQNAVRLVRQRNSSRVVDVQLVQRCESFQRRWFPVVRATLDRFHPEIADLFFKDLVQLEGKEAPLSVMEFLGNLERLAQGNAPFGEEGPEIRELLVTRMLTAEVEAEGHALVDEWEKAAKLVETEPKGVEAEAAVEALWKWRMEWSRLARTLLTQRRVLRELGIGRRRGASEADEADADDETLALGSQEAAPALPSEAEPVGQGAAHPTERVANGFASISIPIGSPSIVPGRQI